MKGTTAYAFTWIATAVAISVATYVTKSAIPLWALLIPACLSLSHGDNKNK